MSQDQDQDQNVIQVRNQPSRPKDPVFKRLFVSYFNQSSRLSESFTVTPGLQVGQLQLEIDAAVSANESLSLEAIQQQLEATPFRFFRRLNFVEFKSIADPLDPSDFARITARALLGWADRPATVGKDEVVSCIVSAALPRDFLKQVKPAGRPFKAVGPGVYFHPGYLFPVYLIVCNLLPVEEQNYPLLVFSSGKKLKAYLEEITELNLEVYLEYVARLHPEETLEFLTTQRRRKGMTTEQEESIFKALVDMYGLERIIQVVGPERLANLIEPQIIAQTLGPERLAKLQDLARTAQPMDVKATGEALKNALSPDELEQLRQILGS